MTKEVAADRCQDARFIWLEPISPELIVGQLKQFAEACGAQSIRIPAYGFGEWPAAPGLAKDGEKIVLHFHGGAYVVSTTHVAPALP